MIQAWEKSIQDGGKKRKEKKKTRKDLSAESYKRQFLTFALILAFIGREDGLSLTRYSRSHTQGDDFFFLSGVSAKERERRS